MNRFAMSSRRYFFAAMAGAAVICVSLAAQTINPAAKPLPVRTVPAGDDLNAQLPFALNSSPGTAFHIIPSSEMSPDDQALLARSETKLHQDPELLNVGFPGGNWRYGELSCPTFPHHLLLRFERDNGKGDVSAFSVSIPRENADKVRVLPVLRRSYSLFSPAPGNEYTIAIFNRLLSEEKTATKPDWVSLANCYAAFANQYLELNPPAPIWRTAPEPLLSVDIHGRASIHIVTLDTHPQMWELKFAQNGRLLSARTSSASGSGEYPMKAIPAGGRQAMHRDAQNR